MQTKTAILRMCLEKKCIGYQNLRGGRVGVVYKEKWDTTDGVKILYSVCNGGNSSAKSEIPPRIDTPQEQQIA